MKWKLDLSNLSATKCKSPLFGPEYVFLTGWHLFAVISYLDWLMTNAVCVCVSCSSCGFFVAIVTSEVKPCN